MAASNINYEFKQLRLFINFILYGWTIWNALSTQNIFFIFYLFIYFLMKTFVLPPVPICSLARPYHSFPLSQSRLYFVLAHILHIVLSMALYCTWHFRLCLVFVYKFIFLANGAMVIVVGRHESWNSTLSAASIWWGGFWVFRTFVIHDVE